ncbi:acyltransferase [Chengkuizengella sp. SCS-71B]|uniref:acyltransferase n=1 Tax=Chengkuizengella sp. SCS-71B TaxID=3115290 RepID=UPI0032C22B7D
MSTAKGMILIMSRLKRLNFYLKIIFYKFILKKDPMEIKVRYYMDCGVKIGKNMRAFSPLISAEPYLLEFGDDVTISTGVKFTTHDNSASKVIPNSTDLFGRIKIGNNCFIGQNSLILPGIELVDNIIVGSGSVVTKSFKQEGLIIAGNPAKPIGSIVNYKEKYLENALNTKGLSFEEKRIYLLNNQDLLIKK